MPSEPEESNFKHKVRIAAYPMVRLGDVLWAYMGPPDARPAAARDRVGDAARRRRSTSRSACSARTTCRRSKAGSTRATSRSRTASASTTIRCTAGSARQRVSQEGRPAAVRGRRVGRRAVHRRAAQRRTTTHYYWRITQYVMPWYTIIPPFGENLIGAHAWVPIDDAHELGVEHQLSPAARPARRAS